MINESDIITNIVIRAYGLMRSGNHAIINWIQQQFPDQSICFLNNITLGASDPYRDFVQIELKNIPEQLPTEALRQLNKHLLIYSYEDRASLESGNGSLLDTLFDAANHQAVSSNLLGHRYHFTTGILRDPFNCFASRIALIRKRGALGGVSNMDLIKENWKQIANKAISLQSQPEVDHIIILYNQWMESDSYRREISRHLMGTYRNNTLDSISTYGGGSSFTVKKRFPLRATLRDASMKWKKALDPANIRHIPSYLRSRMVPKLDTNQLNSRWISLANDDEFRQLFRDKELIDLSHHLFGRLQNEQAFLNSL
jgi:hypothetical protein